jgi:predicted TIM-barrel fold metal-dependent hydrolase
MRPGTRTRRQFLAAAVAAGGVAASAATTPIIDTHLEVWTFDPKFPFHHPERPDLKRVDVEAPIENEVSVMREFGLRYAVLINPRFFGWDNSYISDSLHRYPNLFVAHGLLDPAGPDLPARLRYWIR